MPSASVAGHPRPLPPELILDFEAFRSAISRVSATGSLDAGARLAEAMAAWREYGRVLHEKSSALALIAKGDRDHLYTRHILDSLNPLSLFSSPPKAVIDIGSGGGLPGIPLAIAWPGCRVTLLESRERKAGFLEQALRSLGLRGVRVVCGRVEDLALSEGFAFAEGDRRAGSTGRAVPASQAVFIRALGDLGRLLTAAAPLAEPGARWVYFLGSHAPEEVLSGSFVAGAVIETGLFGGRLLTGAFSESSKQ